MTGCELLADAGGTGAGCKVVDDPIGKCFRFRRGHALMYDGKNRLMRYVYFVL